MDTTRADDRDQDCTVLFDVNKRSLDFTSGVHVGKDDLDVVCVVTKKKRNNVKLDTRRALSKMSVMS